MVNLLQPVPTHPLDYSLEDMDKVHHTPEHPLAGDPLVKLEDNAIACKPYDQRGILIPKANPLVERTHKTKHIWVRKTVAEKLRLANKILHPEGVELYVKSGYRPLEVQQELWNYFLKDAEDKLGTTDKHKITAHAQQFCANPEAFDPRKPRTWSPHFTGGAVDLTLRTLQNKQELDMDPPGYGEQCYTHYTENLPPEKQTSDWHNRRTNRRLLYNAMTEAGFTNYPYEWWHYDYGTPLYALAKQPAEPTFFYGVMPHPEKSQQS